MSDEHIEISEQSLAEKAGLLSLAGEQRLKSNSIIRMLQRSWLSRMLRAIGNPPVQLVLWNGEQVSTHRGEPVARVFIRDYGALLKLLLDPELNFGELYAARRIELQGNLLEFLEAVFRVLPMPGYTASMRSVLALFGEISRNSIPGARHNIRHHYDIGNDFYKLWLDRNMLYTCAYFPARGVSLEQAQLAKMDHICRKLRLKPGDKVLEIGSGWGGLALHMARHYGARVHAYNISSEQVAYAKKRSYQEGVAGQVEFIEDDYRNAHGKYDAFVSVGMLEHVGLDNFQAFGKVIDRTLKENGRGLLHSIGFNFQRPMDVWTEKHIFPGAHPPSLVNLLGIFEPYDFSVLDVENLRLHYAETLGHWLQRFNEHAGQIASMFDQEFVRTWRLYLAGSQASFRTGGMQLFQVCFARAWDNTIPRTRQYLYEPWNHPAGVADGAL